MTPRPTRSTLFPYTTLFRSRKEEYEARIRQALGVLNEVSNDNTTPRNIRRSAKDAMDALQAMSNTIGVRASNAISIDRKSTRLNSSHTVISYAVFCLKKKTK